MKVYFYLQENKFSSASNKSFIGGKQKFQADETFCLSGGKSRLVRAFPLVDQLAYRFFHRHDAGCPPGIASCESVAVLEVPFEGIVQGCYDTVGASRDIACLDAVERTDLRLFHPGFYLFEKMTVDCSARHSDRTFDDLDILLLCLDVAFLESIGSVALGSGDETGS